MFKISVYSVKQSNEYVTSNIEKQCKSGKMIDDRKSDDVESAEVMRKMFPEIFKDPTHQELSVMKWGDAIRKTYG